MCNFSSLIEVKKLQQNVSSKTLGANAKKFKVKRVVKKWAIKVYLLILHSYVSHTTLAHALWDTSVIDHNKAFQMLYG